MSAAAAPDVAPADGGEEELAAKLAAECSVGVDVARRFLRARAHDL